MGKKEVQLDEHYRKANPACGSGTRLGEAPVLAHSLGSDSSPAVLQLWVLLIHGFYSAFYSMCKIVHFQIINLDFISLIQFSGKCPGQEDGQGDEWCTESPEAEEGPDTSLLTPTKKKKNNLRENIMATHFLIFAKIVCSWSFRKLNSLLKSWSKLILKEVWLFLTVWRGLGENQNWQKWGTKD